MKRILFCLIFSVVLIIGYSQTSNNSRYVLPAFAQKYNDPQLGKNVFVFEPGMDSREIQTLIDTIFVWQSGRGSEFTANRYAFLFKPGTYNLDVKVGYYMQILGLGASPEDVTIKVLYGQIHGEIVYLQISGGVLKT